MNTGEQLKFVRVKDAYKRYKPDILTVRSGELIHKAIENFLMKPEYMTIYVVDGKHKLLGSIPLVDLIRVTAARFSIRKSGFSNFFQYFSDVMDNCVDDTMRMPITIREGDNLIKAFKLMADYNLTDLPVVDNDGILIGELNSAEIMHFALEGVKRGDEMHLKKEKIKEEEERGREQRRKRAMMKK